MKYLYTNTPQDDCREFSPGVYGRVAQSYEEEELKASGWVENPDKLEGAKDAKLHKEKKGQKGQQEVDEVREELAEQYKAKFGKRPHHKLKPEKILEALQEAVDDDESGTSQPDTETDRG